MLLAWLLTSAFAAPPSVTVTVLDEAGAPIPHAVVVERSEREKHRVNEDNGAWTERVLYPPDGQHVVMKKGTRLELDVMARGYERVRLEHRVARKNHVEVVLPRAPLATSAGTSAFEVEALAAYAAWVEADEARMAADDSDEMASARERDAAALAAERVREWMDATSDARALELCLHVGSYAYCGM
jgi:hypothetical protein